MKIIERVSSGNTQAIQIYVNGGNKQTYEFLSPIIQWLSNIPNSSIIFNEAFPSNKSDYEWQTLGLDASGKFYTSMDEVFCNEINLFQSPEKSRIISADKGNYEYPLVEVDFIGDNYIPISKLNYYEG